MSATWNLRRILGGLSVVACWMLVVADSAGPTYERIPMVLQGEKFVALESEYDCLPGITLSQAAYSFKFCRHADDYAPCQVILEGHCVEDKDCLGALDITTGWGEDGVATCAGWARAFPNDGTLPDPDVSCTVVAEPPDEGESCNGYFSVVVTKRDGTKSGILYQQFYQNPGGYGCD